MSDLKLHGAAPLAAPVRQPVRALVGGAFVLVCALTATWSATVPGREVHFDGAPREWTISPVTWVSLLALATAGTVMMTAHRWAGPAAVVAAVVGFQVAIRALVMTRAWLHAHSTTGLDPDQLTHVVTYAALVAVMSAAAAVAAVATAWREPSGWRGAIPARPGYVVLGMASVVLLPLVWSTARDHRIEVILMYALPWGAGTAAMGWLRGRAAIAAGTAVAGCVALYALVVIADHALTHGWQTAAALR